jgi:hypothetical protein
MPTDKPKSNFFRLDSNIDGVYTDSEGVEQTIENIIQAVGATDGSQSIPISGSGVDVFGEDEVPTIPDLTVETGNRGHGILYDSDGKAYAKKGDLVLRDANSEASLASIVKQVKSIFESKSLDVRLLDKSIQTVINSKQGIDLDTLIKRARTNESPFGIGNIVQATRNEAFQDISVSTFTIPLSNNNVVWVLGHASVRGEGAIQLRDVSSDTILHTSYIKTDAPLAEGVTTPAYISFVGTLPEGGSSDDCCENIDRAIYNSFFKRFFKKTTDGTNIHELAIEMIPQDEDELGDPIIIPFTQASVNVLVMDEIDIGGLLTGFQVVEELDEIPVSFDQPLDDINYSIAIQTASALQYWYKDKTVSGFTIKFERKYSGKIFWTAIGGNV